MYSNTFWELPYLYAGLVSFGMALLVAFFHWMTVQMHIIVTDKRVQGKSYFGRALDLPIDSISSIKSQWFGGITIATASGQVSFLCIENVSDIRSEISKLLILRQESTSVGEMPIYANQISNADEIKKYKELLDAGVINQEEFDAKKKQLLNL